MRRNRIFAVVLAIVTFLSITVFSACKKPEEEQEYLTQRMQNFVDAVEAIQTPITLNSGAAIDAAYVAYAFLDEFERDSKTVAEHKTILDGYQSQYVALKGSDDQKEKEDPVFDEQKDLISAFIAAVNALPAGAQLTLDHRTAINGAYEIYSRLDVVSKEDASVIKAYVKLSNANEYVTALEYEANLEIWQQAADQFIRAVADIDEVTIDSGDVLEDLLYEYKNFPDGVKNIGGMNEAKATLDEKYQEYLVLRDEYDIEQFVAAVRKIGRTEVTLSSEGDILKAESIYKYMSDNAKKNSSVVSSYKKLCTYRAQFDELFAIAEAEKIARFIQAANKIPTDIENVDITWYQVLYEASQAYFALSFDSMTLPEVEAAFKRWDAAQSAFDKMGYQKIPDFSVNIVFSADSVPFIVMQLFVENTAPIREFYGVSTNAQLQQYAALYLDIYVDGVYVTKTEINMNSLANGFILQNVNTLLRNLSAKNSQIIGGANFSFAVHFEDRAQERIPTSQTTVSKVYNYTW